MRVEAIQWGERRREVYGDIDGLADNIRRRGLLHPIVVTAGGVLVSGGRRLRAHEVLGRAYIDVTMLGDLSEADIRDIELDENIFRLDLTAHERNKLMIEKVKRARAEAVDDADSRSTVERESARPRGGQAKAGSVRDIARRTGASQTTVQRTTAHAAAIEAYPFLDDRRWQKSFAIEAHKILEANPERRDELLRRITDAGLTGSSAVDHMRACVRGRLTTVDPGAAPQKSVTTRSDEERVAARQAILREAALKEGLKFIVLAAREFDDDRGTRLREMATEIQAMLGAL